MIDVSVLEKKATELRRAIIEMISAAGSGHPGGSLSAADLITALYFHEMKIDPKNPHWEERDYFVLSKGHAAPALYAALALKGFCPVCDTLSLRKMGSKFQGHPCAARMPGIEVSTGSLGQGISAACGLAKAMKMDDKPNRVYVMLGDGECEEGQVWEAAMFAAHYKLDNLVAILDRNRLQIDGRTTDVMSPEPLDKKFTAFGWRVLEIDGHNMEEIVLALADAKKIKNAPTLILANTIKGKGVSFMEDQAGWHGNAPKAEQTEQALAELV
ncbi:MAG: transketolase [Clostridia bacterium]|nr:transketolase [Clostridia bacterium]MDD4572013.1 transketolase [Clostridia bacterium]